MTMMMVFTRLLLLRSSSAERGLGSRHRIWSSSTNGRRGTLLFPRCRLRRRSSPSASPSPDLPPLERSARVQIVRLSPLVPRILVGPDRFPLIPSTADPRLGLVDAQRAAEELRGVHVEGRRGRVGGLLELDEAEATVRSRGIVYGYGDVLFRF